MAIQFQHRRGTNAESLAFTGASAEITVDTTNKRVRVHDGFTQGGVIISDFVNVKDYGAIGDGVVNDTQAFKDALATNKVLMVEDGTYILEGIVLNTNILYLGMVNLVIDGTTISMNKKSKTRI